uniref:Uncharacterized protein n=1 Tax=Arundo donax TaxID=35708 RepID=A0A0A9C9V1_ARUDO
MILFSLRPVMTPSVIGPRILSMNAHSNLVMILMGLPIPAAWNSPPMRTMPSGYLLRQQTRNMTLTMRVDI